MFTEKYQNRVAELGKDERGEKRGRKKGVREETGQRINTSKSSLYYDATHRTFSFFLLLKQQ